MVSRFFEKKGTFTLKEIIDACECQVIGDIDMAREVTDIRALEDAQEGHVSFLANNKYKDDLKETKASFCFIHQNAVKYAPEGLVCLVSMNPHRSYAIATTMFYGFGYEANASDISANAYISKTAKLGDNCVVKDAAVIEDDVVIGNNCYVGYGAVIEKGVHIGDHSKIHANCVISHADLGHHVQVFPGAKIGQSGFGYAMDPRGHVPVPQLGQVVIGNHVEIGANTSIDRGSWKNTIIGDNCVIDNLVMIAHNVEIGAGSVIVAQVGISGSTKLGRFVVMGGQAGSVGHIEIGDGAQVGAQAGVTKSIPAGMKVNGTPAMELNKCLRKDVLLRKLANKEISLKTNNNND
ncbi:MAG: UDP-3-O-(3-hydroxymyristoyl)glucosamine N-acyltransferase [Rickettsiales bacterium]|nr:UDP-3-O-(3-hydroxymyristoyl)glucosamine N-acyltransferase [Rickettsiales bacterium]